MFLLRRMLYQFVWLKLLIQSNFAQDWIQFPSLIGTLQIEKMYNHGPFPPNVFTLIVAIVASVLEIMVNEESHNI